MLDLDSHLENKCENKAEGAIEYRVIDRIVCVVRTPIAITQSVNELVKIAISIAFPKIAKTAGRRSIEHRNRSKSRENGVDIDRASIGRQTYSIN